MNINDYQIFKKPTFADMPNHLTPIERSYILNRQQESFSFCLKQGYCPICRSKLSKVSRSDLEEYIHYCEECKLKEITNGRTISLSNTSL